MTGPKQIASSSTEALLVYFFLSVSMCPSVSMCIAGVCQIFLETIRIAGGGSGAEKNILSKFGKSETARRGQKQPILSQLSQLSWL